MIKTPRITEQTLQLSNGRLFKFQASQPGDGHTYVKAMRYTNQGGRWAWKIIHQITF